jgi:hypothetical protein
MVKSVSDLYDEINEKPDAAVRIVSVRELPPISSFNYL